MLVDRKFMPKAGLLAATRTQNHAETGFLQEIARSPLPEKNRFPQDLCHRLSKGSRVYPLPFLQNRLQFAAKIDPSSSRCRVRNSTLTHQNRTVFKANNSVLSRFGHSINRRYDLLQLSPFRAKRSLILLQLPHIGNYIFHLHWLPRIIAQFKHRKPENFPTA